MYALINRSHRSPNARAGAKKQAWWQRTRKPCRARYVGLEQLEERLLLSGQPIPSLSIDDVSVIEGTAVQEQDGSWVPENPHAALFTVTLSAAASNTVTVNYATEEQTALEG